MYLHIQFIHIDFSNIAYVPKFNTTYMAYVGIGSFAAISVIASNRFLVFELFLCRYLPFTMYLFCFRTADKF